MQACKIASCFTISTIYAAMRKLVNNILLIIYVLISIPTINLPLLIIKLFRLDKVFAFCETIVDKTKDFNTRIFDRLLYNDPIDEPVRYNKLVDTRPQEIVNLPNTIIRDHISFMRYDSRVIFYDPGHSTTIHEYFESNKNLFENSGHEFVLLKDALTFSDDELIAFIEYFLPHYRTAIAQQKLNMEDIRRLVSAKDLIIAYFGLQDVKHPCFVALRNLHIKENKSEYSIYYLPDSVALLPSAVENYLILLQRRNSVFFQLGGDLENQEEDIQARDIEIDEALNTALQKFVENYKVKGVLSLMSTLILELQKSEVELDEQTKKIAEIIHHNQEHTISKLLVKLNGDLELVDYNIRIKLTPLQKVVYHFFLNHPEGVLFKNLSNYKTELTTLYYRFSSKSDVEEMRESIDELTNPYSNSMSEKCSRIKEAFLKHIHEDLACQYYVQGKRNNLKKITLKRDWVVYEK